MKNRSSLLSLLFFFIATGMQFSSQASEAPVLKKQQMIYGNTVISIAPDPLFTHPNGAFQLVISTKNQEVFRAHNITLLRRGTDLKPLTDLSQIHGNDLMVEAHTGGAHCCQTVSLLRLSPNFKLLAFFDGKNSEITISKLSLNGTYRIQLHDWITEEMWTTFAKSYAPTVILISHQGHTFVSRASMKKNRLSPEAINQIIGYFPPKGFPNFQYQGPTSDTHQHYFEKILEPILDLIYSGNGAQALQIIDQTWPGDQTSKGMFLEDLKTVLKKSAYYKDLQELNKPFDLANASF